MGKLVALKLGDGSFEQGFPVTWQIGEDGDRPSVEITGRLPSAPEIPQHIIASSLERGETYLSCINNEVVGTTTLQESDPLIWGDVPDEAFYVHRLAIRRTYAGRGLGLQLLCWAEEAARAVGKRYLRLDCWAGNDALRRYYESAGFSDRGEQFAGGFHCRLFDKAVSSCSSPNQTTSPKPTILTKND